ncbi:MAG TPA: hypothetical protein P5519_07985 [Spirochaetia bacterium]|nr:hypothetical protein [Spirochaetia bacterium]
MIKKKFSLIFLILSILLQSCVSELTYSIRENNQITIGFTSTMPLIIYSLITENISPGLPVNFSRANVMEKLEKVKGTLTFYKIEQKNDSGYLEITVQFASPESAKQFLTSYGVTINYSVQEKKFELHYAALQAYISEEVSGFISLLIKPFSQTVRVTLPFRNLRAQNGTVSGNTATFTNTFLSLEEFFPRSTYIITW